VERGVDQVPVSAYHALVELFDRSWLTRMSPGDVQAAK
jgi:hypothetical protein